jgi:hypothetical protein
MRTSFSPIIQTRVIFASLTRITACLAYSQKRNCLQHFFRKDKSNFLSHLIRSIINIHLYVEDGFVKALTWFVPADLWHYPAWFTFRAAWQFAFDMNYARKRYHWDYRPKRHAMMRIQTTAGRGKSVWIFRQIVRRQRLPMGSEAINLQDTNRKSEEKLPSQSKTFALETRFSTIILYQLSHCEYTIAH